MFGLPVVLGELWAAFDVAEVVTTGELFESSGGVLWAVIRAHYFRNTMLAENSFHRSRAFRQFGIDVFLRCNRKREAPTQSRMQFSKMNILL